MLLYRTPHGPVLHANGNWFPIPDPWDDLVNDDALATSLATYAAESNPDPALSSVEWAAACAQPLPPIGRQELWAAGVTYQRSRTARMEESKSAAGGDFYDRVYTAVRPEIFFKATAHRVVGPGEPMHLRRDSRWIVPEPELVLVVSRTGKIVGYTAGNDLSCRDIEGENPLYLPQAKTYDRCAALGPAIFVSEEPPAADTAIRLAVRRSHETVVEGATTLGHMKRSFAELVEFLFRDNAHPDGCLLMTGTGVIPPDDFSLQAGDEVEVAIDNIGALVNPMD